VLPVLEDQTRGSQMKNIDEHFMVIWQKRGQETATNFMILAGVSPGPPSKLDDQALEASTERGIEITRSRKSSTERYYMC